VEEEDEKEDEKEDDSGSLDMPRTGCAAAAHCGATTSHPDPRRACLRWLLRDGGAITRRALRRAGPGACVTWGEKCSPESPMTAGRQTYSPHAKPRPLPPLLAGSSVNETKTEVAEVGQICSAPTQSKADGLAEEEE
jgi:hypothetical protein